MAELAELLIKSVAIALLAACAAWAPWAIYYSSDLDMAFFAFPVALLGAFAVGLPIALLTYFLARRQLSNAPSTVFLAANLAGSMMVLVAFILGDLFGGLLFGLPSLIAANVFSLLGYLWIIKPQRETLNG